MSDDLKEYINEYMPHIDEILTEQDIPIHKRFIIAGKLFVEMAVVGSTFESNKDLLESEAYRECVLPLCNNWYFEKYGDLAKGTGNDIYSGIVLAYGQPVELKIPAITRRVLVEGELVSVTFPDHLQESEKFEDLIQPKFDLNRMEEKLAEDLKNQVANVVALTRSINLDLNMVSGLNEQTLNMARGIWSHFEKAISDILAAKNELASVACWEIHLAMEKSLKVLIYSKSGMSKHGHNLDELIKFLSDYEKGISSSVLLTLPSDKDAIKLRYAELIKRPIDAFNYYLIALEFVGDLVSRLKHNLVIKNASITLKKAPWAR